jgi:hypothetical protein
VSGVFPPRNARGSPAGTWASCRVRDTEVQTAAPVLRIAIFCRRAERGLGSRTYSGFGMATICREVISRARYRGIGSVYEG